MTEGLLVLVAVVAGLAIGWALWGRRLGPAADELRNEAVRRAAAEANLENERKAAQEKLAALQEAQARLAETFKALSADALKSNSTQFLELAKENLQKFQEGAKSDLEARQKAVDEM